MLVQVIAPLRSGLADGLLADAVFLRRAIASGDCTGPGMNARPGWRDARRAGRHQAACCWRSESRQLGPSLHILPSRQGRTGDCDNPGKPPTIKQNRGMRAITGMPRLNFTAIPSCPPRQRERQWLHPTRLGYFRAMMPVISVPQAIAARLPFHRPHSGPLPSDIVVSGAKVRREYASWTSTGIGPNAIRRSSTTDNIADAYSGSCRHRRCTQFLRS